MRWRAARLLARTNNQSANFPVKRGGTGKLAPMCDREEKLYFLDPMQWRWACGPRLSTCPNGQDLLV